MRSPAAAVVVLVVAGAWLAWAAGAAAADPAGPRITVAGSGTNLASAHLLAQAFRRVRPDIAVDVPASIGSNGAIKAAADAAIAVGLTSRPLQKDEPRLGLTVRPYARTAVVIAAHPGVPDDGISAPDLVEIYRGRKTRWRDGREIVVLTRQPWDSSLEVLFKEVPGFQGAYEESQQARRWITLFTDQEMDKKIVHTANAIGLSDLGTLVTQRLAMKVLKFEGALPTVEDVRAGRYRLVKALNFVYLPDRLGPEAKAFVEFALSKDGQQLLRANGYLPPD
jgi:phosphate transport system substrate-binding protein